MPNRLATLFPASAYLCCLLSLLLPSVAQGQALSKEELIQRLTTAPIAAPADPDAVFANDGFVTRSIGGNIKAPDASGACDPAQPLQPVAPGVATQRNLVITGPIPIEPGSAPHADLDLKFKFDSDKLSKQDMRQLDALAAALNSGEVGGAHYLVIGHTDARGDPGYNLRLSCARALAALRYLTGHQVAAKRLAAYGFGSARPVGAGNPGAAANRRVEIRAHKPS